MSQILRESLERSGKVWKSLEMSNSRTVEQSKVERSKALRSKDLRINWLVWFFQYFIRFYFTKNHKLNLHGNSILYFFRLWNLVAQKKILFLRNIFTCANFSITFLSQADIRFAPLPRAIEVWALQARLIWWNHKYFCRWTVWTLRLFKTFGLFDSLTLRLFKTLPYFILCKGLQFNIQNQRTASLHELSQNTH